MTGLRMSDRYTNFWRFVFDPAQVEDMDHLITTLESFAEALPQMRKWRDAGIQVDDVQGKLKSRRRLHWVLHRQRCGGRRVWLRQGG